MTESHDHPVVEPIYSFRLNHVLQNFLKLFESLGGLIDNLGISLDNLGVPQEHLGVIQQAKEAKVWCR